MKTKLLLFIFLLTCNYALVKAQQTLEDSLQTAFFKAKENTTAKNLLVHLVSFYLPDNTKTPEEKIHKIQSLIQKKDEPGLNYLLNQIRVMLTPTGDSIIEAIKWIMMGMDEAKKLGAIIEMNSRMNNPEREIVRTETKNLVSFVRQAINYLFI